jgi:hypothetical protein
MVQNIGKGHFFFPSLKKYEGFFLDKLLIRQEKIQLLLEKTEELHQDAFQFERQVIFCTIV